MSLNESEACAVDVSMIENIESDVHFYMTGMTGESDPPDHRRLRIVDE